MLSLVKELREVFALHAKDFNDLLKQAVSDGQLGQVRCCIDLSVRYLRQITVCYLRCSGAC